MRSFQFRTEADVHNSFLNFQIDGQVLLVSYIYTGGDVCEEENIHRYVVWQFFESFIVLL